MKILLIHQYFKENDIKGGARFNEMARIWKEEGHEVTVIAGNLDGPTAKKNQKYKGRTVSKNDQNGIKVYRCNVSESYNKSFLGRLWAYFSFVFSSTYAGLFKVSEKYDVILVTSPPLFVGITGCILSFFKRKPLVFEVRDLWPESAIDTGVITNKLIIKFAFWFEKFVYKRARLINVLTPAFKSKLIEEKNVPESKILFIPNAADFDMTDDMLDNFDALTFKKEKGLDGKFVFTYVGAHGVANDLEQLLQTALRIKDERVLFLLIGDGMKKQELKSTAVEMNIRNVIFLDSMPKIEALKYVAASDVGVSVLKKVDTFKTIYSNKTFDYMSCKKPILLAIDGVSRKLVEKADCGIYVEPENIDSIVKGVNYFANLNPETIFTLGDNGYTFAKANFDRSKLALQYINDIKTKLALN